MDPPTAKTNTFMDMPPETQNFIIELAAASSKTPIILEDTNGTRTFRLHLPIGQVSRYFRKHFARLWLEVSTLILPFDLSQPTLHRTSAVTILDDIHEKYELASCQIELQPRLYRNVEVVGLSWLLVLGKRYGGRIIKIQEGEKNYDAMLSFTRFEIRDYFWPALHEQAGDEVLEDDFIGNNDLVVARAGEPAKVFIIAGNKSRTEDILRPIAYDVFDHFKNLLPMSTDFRATQRDNKWVAYTKPPGYTYQEQPRIDMPDITLKMRAMIDLLKTDCQTMRTSRYMSREDANELVRKGVKIAKPDIEQPSPRKVATKRKGNKKIMRDTRNIVLVHLDGVTPQAERATTQLKLTKLLRRPIKDSMATLAGLELAKIHDHITTPVDSGGSGYDAQLKKALEDVEKSGPDGEKFSIDVRPGQASAELEQVG
ncbi:hypothetical protein HII31_02952 [Pseudocercospora fuligena]|uniref:Uncharacterized protein n=1 Tax=Pseudocercospora fuligena TaxID=685502 RepID=A0A8H6RR21_9PEZI|nr:hypothetical protein HII31_02952 [Pseudocercospora fuligena]